MPRKRKPPRWAVTPGQRRMGHRARKAAGDALYHQEMRTHIARRLALGAAPGEIAKELKVSRKVVEGYVEQSLVRASHYEEELRNPGERDAPTYIPGYRRAKRGDGPGPHVAGSRKAPPDPEVFEGEVLDPPDEREFKRRAYDLRKRAIPFDEIAEILGRSEADCRRAVNERLRRLEQDEVQDASLAKRLMLEQIDAMIAAITVPATGRDIDGNPAPVVLEAIDRMVKLFDRKAKLLGLDAPQKVDINHRLEILAQDNGYDVEELRQIASDVIAAYAAKPLR